MIGYYTESHRDRRQRGIALYKDRKHYRTKEVAGILERDKHRRNYLKFHTGRNKGSWSIEMHLNGDCIKYNP